MMSGMTDSAGGLRSATSAYSRTRFTAADKSIAPERTSSYMLPEQRKRFPRRTTEPIPETFTIRTTSPTPHARSTSRSNRAQFARVHTTAAPTNESSLAATAEIKITRTTTTTAADGPFIVENKTRQRFLLQIRMPVDADRDDMWDVDFHIKGKLPPAPAPPRAPSPGPPTSEVIEGAPRKEEGKVACAATERGKRWFR
ncbi:hypothetical protein DHEL01_v209019 [Diaporthe helianthi]|uniref:Uncharacterized protein n=1 Tax=Diaporthe helianthi TaxID=158607 RepID=A0A2P5HQQ9_DIAHE|nr:hypothetical protein DHEL01_v209019 [Diaporthe helianthi]